MSQEDKINAEKLHRKFAIECFNQTWDLLDKTKRTPEEEAKMLHAAHASRYHWEEIGTPLHFARGDWQLSRVYAVLGFGTAAFKFAESSLKLCEDHGIGDFDLAFAYEALARASAVLGDATGIKQYLKLAKQAANEIEKEDDKAYFLQEVETVRNKK